MRSAARGALLGLASLLGGCVYLNSLYNAQRLFDEAERATWTGRDADARPLYDSVVAKSARSYRRAPEGRWADDALYLLGRAHLRRGDAARAEAALWLALELSDDEEILAGARLHLGIAAWTRGDRARALDHVDDALGLLESDALRAEAHLWRARILLESGAASTAWRDLDRAADLDPRHRLSAGLERLRWGVVQGDSVRAREGVLRLLGLHDAHVREDTVRALVARAARHWGPASAVDLLAGAREAAWPQASRDRLLLERARFHLQAGDEPAALADASPVADGAGDEVAEARLFMARVLSLQAREVEELERARAILLPAVENRRVLELLESIRMVEILAGQAAREGPPEALFAAAEIARDQLGARELARSLLLGYADTQERVWGGKALLAALDLTTDPERRPPLLRRMARMRRNPYVAAAASSTGGPPPRIRELDAELQDTLTRVVERAAERARQLDVLARERADTSR